jgi:hypothetical protein
MFERWANHGKIKILFGAVAELADAGDLKSSEGNLLWVRLPPALLDFPSKSAQFVRVFGIVDFYLAQSGCTQPVFDAPKGQI